MFASFFPAVECCFALSFGHPARLSMQITTIAYGLKNMRVLEAKCGSRPSHDAARAASPTLGQCQAKRDPVSRTMWQSESLAVRIANH